MQLNTQEIINRGYVFHDEYHHIMSNESKLEKLRLVIDEKDFAEGIWIYPLESSDKKGTSFHFVFLNDPVMFGGGPRPIAGMIGIATSNGPDKRALATANACIECFTKAGQAAIDYFWKMHDELNQDAN